MPDRREAKRKNGLAAALIAGSMIVFNILLPLALFCIPSCVGYKYLERVLPGGKCGDKQGLHYSVTKL